MTRSLAAAALLPLALFFASARADAVEVPYVGGRPLLVDVTNTSVLAYHFDNRDDSKLNVATQVNDFYGEWLDRLNIQLDWWRLRLGMRLDSALFFHPLDRDGVAALVADQTKFFDDNPKALSDYTNRFYDELHSRFRRALYPSKLVVGYAQPGIDVTVGDFYVQLGRGLVFSVRKIDELAVDTTVRGAKVVADRDLGAVRLAATLFAGQMNPLRVDETSGRRLNGEGSALFFGFPRAGDLETYDPQVGRVVTVTQPGAPSYLEDTAAGGRVELGTNWFSLAVNAAMLLRRSHTLDNLACHRAGDDRIDSGNTSIRDRCAALFPDVDSTQPSRIHARILNVSGSINVPSILRHGDVYLEVAGQQMGDGYMDHNAAYQPTQPKADVAGYAIYGSASITGGPVAVSIEGKHYRNFFPLTANIQTQTPGFGAPEFALVAYSQPPTADPIYAEVVRGGSPNVCVSGARTRVDYRFNREAMTYAWLGRSSSWSEIPVSIDGGCMIDNTHRTDTWDAAMGVDLGFESSKTHVKAWVGTRNTTYADLKFSTSQGEVFYREGYVRYDIVKHLSGPFSLQFQGFHRHRAEPLIPQDNAWTEGENYTALQWSPHLSAVVGYEYVAKAGCQSGRPATLSLPAREAQNMCHFVNGGLQWRSAGGEGGASKVLAQIFNSVGIFVGQRRAALRCVSGVCRQFPPFEGARIEMTSRF